MPRPEDLMESHPDDGTLHEWLDGQLAEAAQVEAHVAGCASCQARVAEARGLIAASHRILTALDDVPANVVPQATVARTSPRRRALPWQRLGQIAAVLVLGVTGVYVAKNSSRDATLNEELLTRAAPAMALQDTSALNRKADVRDAGSADMSVSQSKVAAKEAPAPAAAMSPPASPPNSSQSSTKTAAPLAQARVARDAVTSSVPATDRIANTAGAGGVAAAAGSAVANQSASDSLSKRLETERRGRMATEMVAVDTMKRPRVEPVVTAFAPKSSAAQTLSMKAAPLLFRMDSVTLKREACATAGCDGYTLHVDRTGAVRFATLADDRALRTASTQLSAQERNSIEEIVMKAFAKNAGGIAAGRISCTLPATSGSTLVLMVTLGATNTASVPRLPCDVEASNVLKLGAQIDSLVDVQKLKRLAGTP